MADEVVRDAKGRWIKAPVSPSRITKENAAYYHQLRKEKAAQLLRQRIVESTSKVSDLELKGSPAAVAEAGGILWSEIVLNQAAYPRDRLEAWEKIAKHAAILGDMQQQQGSVTNNVLVLDDNARAVLSRLLGDTYATRTDVLSGVVDVSDNDSYRNHPDNPDPPLPHSTACLPADDDMVNDMVGPQPPTEPTGPDSQCAQDDKESG